MTILSEKQVRAECVGQRLFPNQDGVAYTDLEMRLVDGEWDCVCCGRRGLREFRLVLKTVDAGQFEVGRVDLTPLPTFMTDSYREMP